jgi:hypothetical protein
MALFAAILTTGTAQAADPFTGGAKVAAGGAVALSDLGTVAVVGNTFDSGPAGTAPELGAIRILARVGTTWKSSAPIYQQASSQHAFNRFGTSVAISPDGKTVVAGASGSGGDFPGRTEVFSVTVGDDDVPQATSVAVLSGASNSESFGASVAVTHTSAHTIVAVGAPDASIFSGGETPPKLDVGKVYLFVDPAGTPVGTPLIDPPSGTSNARMGASVAISADGGTIAAGAPGNGGQSNGTGAVDVFTGSGTEYALTTRFAGTTPGGALGTSVALTANASEVLAGEPMTGVFPAVHGDARMLCLKCASVPESARFPDPIQPQGGGHPGDGFGSSVSLSGAGYTAVIGAPYDDSGVTAGSAYVEDASSNSTATTEQVLVPARTTDQGLPGSAFGQSVAISASGYEVLVGAPYDGEIASLSGAASAAAGVKVAAAAPVGSAFVWNRPEPVACPAFGCGGLPQPQPSPTPPVTTSPAAQLVQSCTSRSLSLLNVLTRKGRVALLGTADASLIGQKVAIRYADGSQVATAVVGSDGFFSTTAPLPPKADRGSSRARYMAVAGTLHSLDLKLTRRVVMQSPKVGGGKVTLSGTVVAPLTKPRSTITVRQRLSCGGKETVVARIHPAADGSFKTTFAAPKGAKAAIYRVATGVRKTAANPKRYPTFSLPQAVNLG